LNQPLKSADDIFKLTPCQKRVQNRCPHGHTKNKKLDRAIDREPTLPEMSPRLRVLARSKTPSYYDLANDREENILMKPADMIGIQPTFVSHLSRGTYF